MKDYKSAYEQAKGENAELRKQIDWLRDEMRRRNDRDSEVRERFKELLLDVLGR